MSLRIAFDCDGVIADLDSALEEVALRLFGEPAAPSEPASGPGAAGPAREADDESPAPLGEEEVGRAGRRTLTPGQRRRLWDEVRRTEHFWESLAETEPGIVSRLARVAEEGRWEVIFLTQRPSTAGGTTLRQTQHWLAEHGFDHPSVFVVRENRGKIADALSLDVVVDDRPENCLDVVQGSRARAILVWNDDPSTLPPNATRLGIEPVPGIVACLDLLAAEAAPEPGLVDRLRRFIGRR